MSGKVWNDDELFKFQAHCDHLSAEFCKIIFVCAADFSDETMNMKSFDRAGDLRGGPSSKLGSQMLVLKATDGELSACYGFEEQLVVIIKEIKAFVGAVISDNCSGDFFQFLCSGAWIVDSRDKLNVPAVGGDEKTGEGREGVDSFLHLGKFH